jgi:hypothetical protein
MAQTKITRDWNSRRRRDDKKAKILRLARSGMSNAEISRVLTREGDPVNRQRVGAILKESLQEAADDRRHIALELFDLELERLSWIVQQAVRICSEPCKACQGQGVFQNNEQCETCRADGKANHPDIRLRAMKEIRNAVHQRAQMLGLYAPEKFALTDAKGNDLRNELRRELESLSEEDLTQALDDFQAGIEAARATMPAHDASI